MSASDLVLAATDLSAPAQQAADRAARVAALSGAGLVLLHALPRRALDDLVAWLGHGVPEQVAQEALGQLQALAAELRARRGVAVQTQLAQGDVLDALPRAAEALDAALVVLGARGAGVLHRLVVGTTAERLLRRMTRPLLVVRTLPHGPYRRALLALDFSPWSAEVLTLARRVAPSARWTLCHAFQVPFEEKLRFAGVDAAVVEHYRGQTRVRATQRLHALAEAAGLRAGDWDPCLAEGDASRCLLEQAQARSSDIVVIGKHGQSAAEDLLLGSVTQHLLAEGTVDVAVATRRLARPPA